MLGRSSSARRTRDDWQRAGGAIARRSRLGVAGGLAVAVLVLAAWSAPVHLSRAEAGTSSSLVRQGAHLVAQSGCLACHQIGSQGNDGPGPSLTTVGARLSAAAIARALDHPREPMPSYEALPARQRQALVAYLVSLKTPRDVIPAPTHQGTAPQHAPSAAQRAAIEHTILVVYRAAKHRNYAAVCRQYAPGVGRLVVLFVKADLHDRSLHTCAQALKALALAKGTTRRLTVTQPPHFDRITVAGNTATVTFSESGPNGARSSTTLTLVHTAGGWKVGVAVN